MFLYSSSRFCICYFPYCAYYGDSYFFILDYFFQVVAFLAAMEIMAEQFPGAFSGYSLQVSTIHFFNSEKLFDMRLMRESYEQKIINKLYASFSHAICFSF